MKEKENETKNEGERGNDGERDNETKNEGERENARERERERQNGGYQVCCVNESDAHSNR